MTLAQLSLLAEADSQANDPNRKPSPAPATQADLMFLANMKAG